MDYEFSEEQKMLRDTVRGFLQKQYPRSLVRSIEQKKEDYSPDVYKRMAQLGWLGLMIPEEYGGVGGSWVDMAIFYEEAGRALLQSPHLSTVVLCGQAILALGSEAQKQNLLPKIAEGEIICTLALNEPQAGANLDAITTLAVNNGEYMISGTKLFIPYAHRADWLIAVARVKGSSQDGVGLFLVESRAHGVTCVPMDTLSGERLCEVIFNQAKVAKEGILGQPRQGRSIQEIVDKAKVISCAEMLGAARAVLEMAVEYAKERVQFEQPIGTFQALQHKMVNTTMAIDGARWLTYYTAWLMDEGIPCVKERAMVQLQAGEASQFAIREAGQIFGGMGQMQEHDWGLFFRRAKSIELRLGRPYMLRETIAQSLGL